MLTFGSFKLKSGRQSPYFFNAGKFNSGKCLAKLGEFYADAFMDHIQQQPSSKYDILFGPAYKGIPLVAVTASQMFEKHSVDMSYAFNRKEAKDHGEGGVFVGAPLADRNVLVVDDVITAGTAIRETVQLLSKVSGTQLSGVLVALDRMERGPDGGLSAIDQIRRDFNIPVICIVTLNEIVQYLQQDPDSADKYAPHIVAIKEYQKQYGC